MLEKTYLPTAFGNFEIIGSELGIQSVKLTQAPIPAELPKTPHLEKCVQQLKEYFAGERSEFDLELDWAGAPEFHRQVWSELLKIPYGHTSSYSRIADLLNNPKAVRAVGMANRNNPIAIIVPCHRVIAKNGQLHGYFYGLDMKRKLLQLENPQSFAEQGTLF